MLSTAPRVTRLTNENSPTADAFQRKIIFAVLGSNLPLANVQGHALVHGVHNTVLSPVCSYRFHALSTSQPFEMVLLLLEIYSGIAKWLDFSFSELCCRQVQETSKVVLSLVTTRNGGVVLPLTL